MPGVIRASIVTKLLFPGTTAPGFLTWPLSRAASRARIHNYWLAYIGILTVSAGFMLVGVFDFVRKLDFSVVSVGTSVLSFMGNVLVLTLIGTDLIIANLHRLAARRRDDDAAEVLREESEAKLRQFCR